MAGKYFQSFFDNKMFLRAEKLDLFAEA